MKITPKTKTNHVVHFLTDERFNELLEAVQPVPLKKRVLDATIGEFCKMTHPKYVERFLREKYAVVAFGKIKQFKAEMQDVSTLLQRWEVGQSADEQRAANGVHFPTREERMLLDACKYFHCQSLERVKGLRGLLTRAAVDVKLCELLLFVKSENASARYNRNYQLIIEHKQK